MSAARHERSEEGGLAPMSQNVIGSLDEIPQGEGRTYGVNGCQIAVFRLRDDSLRALDAVCPHKGGPLADALIDDGVVVCPLHSYTYDLSSGVELSCDGESVGTFPVRADEAGQIIVDID